MAKSVDKVKELAIKTLKIEADAVLKLIKNIDDNFVLMVQLIYNAKGRVVVTGIGKSANIASKIVATFNSTGTPSLFLHAADAIHGDLGMIQKDDIVLCISKSGNSEEIKVLLPLIKTMGNKIIALVSNIDSYLAKQADFVLNATVAKEACPNNLAPTSSTTAQLALGDALAVCLLDYRGFTATDFAKYHPGGTLGKKLFLRVSDIYSNNALPMVDVNDSIREVIMEISEKRLGATAVLENNRLVGIITDGDLRRMLEKNEDFNQLNAGSIMNKFPKMIEENTLAAEAFGIMEKYNITQLLIVRKGEYVGVIHIHDLLKEGII